MKCFNNVWLDIDYNTSHGQSLKNAVEISFSGILLRYPIRKITKYSDGNIMVKFAHTTLSIDSIDRIESIMYGVDTEKEINFNIGDTMYSMKNGSGYEISTDESSDILRLERIIEYDEEAYCIVKLISSGTIAEMSLTQDNLILILQIFARITHRVTKLTSSL